MYCSTQERTNVLRNASVWLAAENHLDQDHPPREMRTLRWGCLALSLRSWLKLPLSGYSVRGEAITRGSSHAKSHASALPSTES
jgi:hypothetical protein